jgi:hypothetical protein
MKMSKTKKKKMNIELLRKVQQSLLRQSLDPTHCRYNQRYWGAVYDFAVELAPNPVKPVCNTQACLAGEAVLQAGIAKIDKGGGIKLFPEYLKNDSANSVSLAIRTAAKQQLNLTEPKAERLFAGVHDVGENAWPEHLVKEYDACKTATERALVAAKRIELFIQTKGRE